MDVIDTIRELVMTPGVSGFESPVRKVIREKVEQYGKTYADSMGNLCVRLPGKGPGLLISAHMDEIGMIVTRVDERGYVRFRTIGRADFGGVMGSEVDFRFLAGRVVHIHTQEGDVTGVIGMLPPHLMSRKGGHLQPPSLPRMSIDVGATSPEEVRDMGIQLMDPVTIEKTFNIMREKILCARSLDNRYACGIILEVLKRIHGNDLDLSATFAWTVQEEVGARGASFLGHRLSPEFAIVVDSNASTDFPHAPGNLPVTRLGSGPVIRWIDNRSIASPPMVSLVREVAHQKRIPYQIGVIYSGTDASVFQQEGAITVTLAVPIRYTHTPVEMIHMDDYVHLIDLIEAAALELNERGGLGEP